MPSGFPVVLIWIVRFPLSLSKSASKLAFSESRIFPNRQAIQRFQRVLSLINFLANSAVVTANQLLDQDVDWSRGFVFRSALQIREPSLGLRIDPLSTLDVAFNDLAPVGDRYRVQQHGDIITRDATMLGDAFDEGIFVRIPDFRD